MASRRRFVPLFALVFFAFNIAAAVVAFAQTSIPSLPYLQILPPPPAPGPMLPPGGGSEAYFGGPIAVDKRRMIVSFASGNYVSAYVRDSSNAWVLDSKIPLPEGPVWITQVGLSGNVAAVAATSVDEGPSAIYIFRLQSSGWTFVQKLTEPAAEPESRPLYFAYKLALAGDVLAVSNFADRDDRGAVYVWRKTAEGTFAYQQKITTEDEGTTFFGWGLATDGESIAIASTNDGGIVSIFKRSLGSWTLEQSVTSPPVGTPVGVSQRFGDDVAISGRSLIVASPNADQTYQPIFRTGAAFVYRRTDRQGWQLEKKLVDPVPERSGLWAVQVGAQGKRVAVTSPGHVYVYQRDNGAWTPEGQDFGDPRYGFGYDLGWSGSTMTMSERSFPSAEIPYLEGRVTVYDFPPDAR